jgi:Phytanoyl-CoA dioxygenase (PhyH)
VGNPVTYVLTDANHRQYDRDGYLIVDHVDVPDGTLDAIVEELHSLYASPPRFEDGVRYGGQRIKNAWKRHPPVKTLALAPNVLATLESLYGRKPVGWQTLNFWKGTEQPAHSDTIHFNSDPPGFMCGVWVALEDIDMDKGPVVYYPGSHKLPEITMKDVGAPPDPDEYEKYEEYIAEFVERENLEPHYATLSKGQALIWAANLLHGGSNRSGPKITRHSQVTHYFFEGCRIWQPLSSSPAEGKVAWLEFERIT